MAERNATAEPTRRMQFRIGVNQGDVVYDESRVYGDGVNIAARLEGIAEPGGVCISGKVFDEIQGRIEVACIDLGPQQLKNIAHEIRVYRLELISNPLVPPAASGTLPSESRAAAANREYRASLAVLPFRTLQQDESDAYFAEGIIDDIIRALDGLKDLLVIARSSTQPFARAPLDLRRVGNALDVRYALHGSVRRSGEALRIAAELCETQTGQVLWADRFDGKTSELFDLQDQIALRVATSIMPYLRQRELIRVRRKHPESMTAYDFTLQALHFIHQLDRTSIAQARTLLEQAVAHDPDYALAYAYMASLRMKCIGQGWSEDEMADRTMAASAAELAIARDGNDALALAIYGSPTYSRTTAPAATISNVPWQPARVVRGHGLTAV
jgi:adenylate cyclase